MTDNANTGASSTTNQGEGEDVILGSQEAKEEGLAYHIVSGAVNLGESGEGDLVTPSRDEKPDLGREPEYYHTEHSGGNPNRSEVDGAMDRNEEGV